MLVNLLRRGMTPEGLCVTAPYAIPTALSVLAFRSRRAYRIGPILLGAIHLAPLLPDRRARLVSRIGLGHEIGRQLGSQILLMTTVRRVNQVWGTPGRRSCKSCPFAWIASSSSLSQCT